MQLKICSILFSQFFSTYAKIIHLFNNILIINVSVLLLFCMKFTITTFSCYAINDGGGGVDDDDSGGGGIYAKQKQNKQQQKKSKIT